MLSSLVPIFKRKGDSLSSNSYRGIRLLEHAFKVYEKVLYGRLTKLVGIDKMQYRIMLGKGTVDPVLISPDSLKNLNLKTRNCFSVC